MLDRTTLRSSAIVASSSCRRSVHNLRERTPCLVRNRAKELQPSAELPLVPSQRLHHLRNGGLHEATQIVDVPLKTTVVWLRDEVKSSSRVPYLSEPVSHEVHNHVATWSRIAI